MSCRSSCPKLSCSSFDLNSLVAPVSTLVGFLPFFTGNVIGPAQTFTGCQQQGGTCKPVVCPLVRWKGSAALLPHTPAPLTTPPLAAAALQIYSGADITAGKVPNIAKVFGSQVRGLRGQRCLEGLAMVPCGRGACEPSPAPLTRLAALLHSASSLSRPPQTTWRLGHSLPRKALSTTWASAVSAAMLAAPVSVCLGARMRAHARAAEGLNAPWPLHHVQATA